MSLTKSEGQMNPDDINLAEVELVQKTTALAKALESNSAPIHRWFWKGLLALNLVLWSVALCYVFVIRFT